MATNEEGGIRDVWKQNLEEEFYIIREIVQKYHYVAMDTEFPGVVMKPQGDFPTKADYEYNILRSNVNCLRLIQLGLTFMDEKGNTAPGISTWQFNFKFTLSKDLHALDSIQLLKDSGIQFERLEQDGIDPFVFAELFTSSGVVLNDDIKFICFHSGYDFGYLLKVLTDQDIPPDQVEFLELIQIYFPKIFDLKFLATSCAFLNGGLQFIARQLNVTRVGRQHQAGSDAHLTGAIYFKLREILHFVNEEPVAEEDGALVSRQRKSYGKHPYVANCY